jgi:hypothetical protein
VICLTGSLAILVSIPLAKNFLFFRLVETALSMCHPVPIEGRVAIVTDVGRDAVDATAPLTNGAKADGEVVWS